MTNVPPNRECLKMQYNFIFLELATFLDSPQNDQFLLMPPIVIAYISKLDLDRPKLSMSFLTQSHQAPPKKTCTRVTQFWILLVLNMMEMVVTIWAIRHAKLQSNHHQRQPAPTFCRLDVLPVAQPTVSEHWREKYTFYQIYNKRTNLLNSLQFS